MRVPVPAASYDDRTESFCVITWLYLNPANFRTSQTSHTTYFGKHLSSHRKSRWWEQQEAEKTAQKVGKVVTKKVCDHRLSRRLEEIPLGPPGRLGLGDKKAKKGPLEGDAWWPLS